MSNSTYGQKTYNYTFWNSQNFYQPPAKKTVTVSIPDGTMILSATLNWQINMQDGARFDNIVFNQNIISTTSKASQDVSSLLVTNGANNAALNYEANVLGETFGQAQGNANVTLQVIVATNSSGQPVNSSGQPVTIGESTPTNTTTPWYVWAIIAVVIMAVIGFIAWKFLKVNPLNLTKKALKTVMS